MENSIYVEVFGMPVYCGSLLNSLILPMKQAILKKNQSQIKSQLMSRLDIITVMSVILPYQSGIVLLGEKMSSKLILFFSPIHQISLGRKFYAYDETSMKFIDLFSKLLIQLKLSEAATV